MPVALTCVGCQRPLRLPDVLLGQTVRCPLCYEAFVADRELATVVSEAPVAVGSAAGDAGRQGAAEAAPPPLPGAEAADVPMLELAEEGPPVAVAEAERPRPLLFTVFISRDPDRVLKGVWDAELTDDGLRLTRPRNPEQWVPVGRGTARYLGGNQLKVRVRGRDLLLTLTRSGSDQVRLTRDVVAFLNNERDPLDPDAYRLPRFLAALALAPLAVPALAVLLGALSGGVAGKVVWGLFGLVLALVSLGLLLRSAWSVRQRVVAGLVTPGVGLAVVGLAFLISLAVPNTIPSGNWLWTGYPNQRAPSVSCQMPGSPMHNNSFHGWQGDFQTVTLEKSYGMDFAVGAVATDAKPRQPGESDLVYLTRLARDYRHPAGGSCSLQSGTQVLFGDPVGYQAVYRVKNSQLDGQEVVRLLAIRGRVYLAAAAGARVTEQQPDVRHFLTSVSWTSALPPTTPRQLGAEVYWPFDNDGVFAPVRQGNATLEAGGLFNNALRLQGGWCDYSNVTQTNFNAGEPFTVVGWVRTRREQGTVLSQRNAGDAAGLKGVLEITIENGCLKAFVCGTAPFAGGESEIVGQQINDDQWHHFALTRDGNGTVELFIDGVSQGQILGASAGGLLRTGQHYLGRAAGPPRPGVPEASSFDGWIDEVGFFHHQLRNDEIEQLARR